MHEYKMYHLSPFVFHDLQVQLVENILKSWWAQQVIQQPTKDEQLIQAIYTTQFNTHGRDAPF